VFLEMLFGWSYELNGSQFVAVIESGNNYPEQDSDGLRTRASRIEK
jgi:hypothetical protein